ncbi:hypothetical protein V1460_20770 [Streptomyces sp. SCSIO 30461]|uniref:hypothetical protein n=1 Tax=Streptomyces sp. SCSIO 30461 TaxID=3118085 RepID=UPI0030CE6F64
MGPKAVAAAGVVVGIATGVVTNLITSRWSWSLAATLAVLAIAAVAIAVQSIGSGTQSRSWVRVRAGHGGQITGSGVTVRDGGSATQTATREGNITDSPATSRAADTRQSATRGGAITNSPVDAS